MQHLHETVIDERDNKKEWTAILMYKMQSKKQTYKQRHGTYKQKQGNSRVLQTCVTVTMIFLFFACAESCVESNDPLPG